MADDPILDRIAAAIARGERVDWTASAEADESIRAVVRELAIIGRIADVHAAEALPADTLAATHPAESSHADATWGPFRLLEKVGQGAFGEVYRAWDTRLDREVALKLLPSGPVGESPRATTIIEEGRLLARVRHPSVVTIFGAERMDGRVGLWMEFVKGRTLEDILMEAGLFACTDVIAIGLELCRALSAVHDAGLLHGDIKAQNAMRSEDGRIVLMDFGAGRMFDEDAPADLAGTPLYLAPEVWTGQPATAQSDIYSLGVLLFHLVTGSYPVRARTVRDVREAHERGERTAVDEARRDVPSGLGRVIDRAIDPRPERRHRNAAEFGAALAALQPRAKAMRLLWASGAAAAVLVAAGATWEIAGRQFGAAVVPSALVRGWTRLDIERPVIAVLPFRNLSADFDSDWFVDGLTDEIIGRLATVRGLEVRSRASSFAMKGTPRDLRRIGAELGVNLVVEGSAQRDGTRLRLTAQLMEVTASEPLWFEQFDRELRDVVAIQEEISRAIVDRLQLSLARERRRADVNPDAYDSYLRGRALIDRRGIADTQKAGGFFERAIAIDPTFAPAHAGLANAYALTSFPNRGLSFATAYPIMRPAAVHALRLDPHLAEAHMAMGWVYAFERDWPKAEASFREAIRLSPSLTQAYTSFSVSTLQPLRKFDEALRVLRMALEHDPLSLDLQREIGQVQLFSGRSAEAVETFQRIRQADPEFPFVQTYLARSLILDGKLEEALTLWQPGAIWPVHAYVRMGRRADAERLAVEHAAFPFRMAVIAAALGDMEGAADAVERVAASEPHRVGRLLLDLEPVASRDHPRLVAIRKAFNLP